MDERTRKWIMNVLHLIVLALSAGLIVYISIDTFNGTDFMTNRRYMNFQLLVCVSFILIFFAELFMADNRRRFIARWWVFFVLSIPYLNIIDHYNVPLTAGQLYFVRFVPLARGVLALVIVVSYISRRRITSILASYIAIMLAVVYFASLIFFYEEHSVNPAVNDYWNALWWACMDATTLGSDIYPVTLVGRILAMAVSVAGFLMFPLFTVYFSSLVQRYSSRSLIFSRQGDVKK